MTDEDRSGPSTQVDPRCAEGDHDFDGPVNNVRTCYGCGATTYDVSPFAAPGECPRCCGETYFQTDPTQPCDGRLTGGVTCGYVAEPPSDSARRQHYIDTGRYPDA